MTKPETIVTLHFANRDATPQVVMLRVERSAASHIMNWYGAYFAGDDYDVFINGTKQDLGINGELEPLTIDATDARPVART
jgi:hypothetical protein